MNTKITSFILMVTLALNTHAFDPRTATASQYEEYYKETFSRKTPQYSFDRFAVSKDQTAQTDFSQWMSSLGDATPISALSIPGTHNSGIASYSGIFPDLVKTQSMSARDQLKAGIRFLDLRLRMVSGSLTVTHGGFDAGSAYTFMDQVRDFLNKNPTEAVLVRIKKEMPNDNSTDFTRFVNTLVKSYGPLFYPWAHASFSEIRLGDIRNQVLLLQDFAGDMPLGVKYDAARIEDSYALQRANDMASKWKKVKAGISTAAQSTYSDGKLFITYSSGSMVAGGEIISPYFVASGEFIQGAARFMSPSYDPDFTRHCEPTLISWIPGLCWTLYTGMNPLLSRMMYDAPSSRTGVIAMDYPGATLIRQITKSNGKGDRSQFEIGKQKSLEIAAAMSAPIYNLKNIGTNACLTNNSYNAAGTSPCSAVNGSQTWRIPTLSETRPSLVYNPADQCLDAFVKPATTGTDIGNWSCHGAPNQKWTFKATGNSFYQIRHGGRSDLCLDGANNKTKLVACSGASSQLWSVIPGWRHR